MIVIQFIRMIKSTVFDISTGKGRRDDKCYKNKKWWEEVDSITPFIVRERFRNKMQKKIHRRTRVVMWSYVRREERLRHVHLLGKDQLLTKLMASFLAAWEFKICLCFTVYCLCIQILSQSSHFFLFTCVFFLCASFSFLLFLSLSAREMKNVYVCAIFACVRARMWVCVCACACARPCAWIAYTNDKWVNQFEKKSSRCMVHTCVYTFHANNEYMYTYV